MPYQLGDVVDRPVLSSSVAHVALALVLDVSGSMQSNGKIESLNEAINGLITQMQIDNRLKDVVDLGIFVFGNKGREPVHQGFRAMSDCEPVYLEANDGSTYVADTLNTAVARLRERVHLYDTAGGAYKPWIVLITDGGFHDDPSALSAIGAKIKERETAGKLHFFGLGVAGYERSQLEAFAKDASRVIDVKAANFPEFFAWVGKSMAVVTGVEIDAKVTLPPLIISA
jgi:uncharacterized protein YegL